MKNTIKNEVCTSKKVVIAEQNGGANKKALRIFMGIAVFAAAVIFAFAGVVMADEATDAVNKFSTFIFGIVRAIGIIILCWGMVQVGMSIQGHDPSQRTQGILTLAGGLIITFAKEILALIGIS